MTADLEAYLAGTWEVDREMVDHDSGRAGRFRGVSTFVAGGDGSVSHEESGELIWGSHRAPATRAWSLRPAAEGYDVHFEDGRFFHRLDLRTGWWTAEHRCGEDVYAGSFWIGSHRSWGYAWEVTGPRKRLELTTRLVRRAG